MLTAARAGLAAILLPIGLTAAVYRPLLRNYFFTDDFLSLYRIANRDWPSYLLMPYFGHAQPVRNGLFIAFFALFGLESSHYFAAVLATHLLNVALLFLVIRSVAGSAALAAFGATLWGVALTHQATLGWYSVYGQVVASTAMLIAVLLAARAADTGRPPGRVVIGLWYVLAMVAAGSFAVGTAMALVWPFVLLVLLPDWRTWGRPLPLWPLLVLVPVLYAANHLGYTLLTGEPIPGWQESLALLHGGRAPEPGHGGSWLGGLSTLVAVASMLLDLFAYGLTQLMAGPLRVRSLPVLSWAVLVATACATAVVAIRGEPRLRRALLASLILAGTAYAAIAVARAPLLQTFAIARPAITDRYHYAATFPLAIILCVMIRQASDWLRLPRGAKSALFAAWLCAFAGVLWVVPFEWEHHDETRRQVETILAALRGTIRARPPGGTVYIANRDFAPLSQAILPAYVPGLAGAFVIYFPDNRFEGRPVRFVSAAPAVRTGGRRIDELLVAPQELPPDAAVVQLSLPPAVASPLHPAPTVAR